MKRYIIFGGQFPSRNGGWGDFKGDATELLDAVAIAQRYDWVHIVDTQQKKIIYEGKTETTNVGGKLVSKWVGHATP